MRKSIFKTLLVVVIASNLMTACSSKRSVRKSEIEANKTQTELNERKIEIMDDYEKCVKKSDTDAETAKCEALLKGAQGL